MIRLFTKSNYQFAVQMKKILPRRIRDRQDKRQIIIPKQEKQITYNPFQALQLIRLHSFTSFTQTIDLCIQLGVNPKHGEQIVRGSASMPSGLGKAVKVAVLCNENLYDELKQKGVDVFIGPQQMKGIQSGITQFDMLFSTPQLVTRLKPFGKMLGPKGLMPNAKIGTLAPQKDLVSAVQKAKAGQVNFRVDSGRNIHAPLGKITFSDEEILKNFKSLMETLIQKKPPSLKGKYFLNAFIKSTMGPRWKLNLQQIDPRHQNSIWDLVQ